MQTGLRAGFRLTRGRLLASASLLATAASLSNPTPAEAVQCIPINASATVQGPTGCVTWGGGNLTLSSNGALTDYGVSPLTANTPGGTLLNHGRLVAINTVTSGFDAYVAGLLNTGTITTITSTGTITGSGTINGGSIAASGGNVIAGITNNGGRIGSLSNSGAISGAGTINVSGAPSGGAMPNIIAGIANLAGTFDSISNFGTISYSGTAQDGQSGNAAIFNKATIYGLYNLAGGAITAQDTGASDFAYGIQNHDGGFIGGILNNAGALISGKGAGILNSGTIGALINNGTIQGTTNAIVNTSTGTLNTIANTGVIAGNIINQSVRNLTITGGAGTIVGGTLTGSSGGIGAADKGTLSSSTADFVFASGNILLNSDVDVTGHALVNSANLTLANPLSLTGTYVSDGGTLNGGTLTSTGLYDLRSGSVVSVLAGSASLTKSTNGTATLSGANTYSGPTTISGGTLAVNGSIVSAVTVNAGGTLGGNGTVGATTVNGGTLAPGNSIGLLTVSGNLAFTAGSTYAVEVSPSAADRVNVTGTATLGGAKVAASFASGTYVAKQYAIVNATGGISGTFGSKVDTNLPSGFKSSLSYDAENAYLDLALDFTPPATGSSPFPNSGLNPNQSGVANALTNYFNSHGGIPVAFGSLGATGLSQAAGEPATGAQTTTNSAMGQFVSTMADPSPEGRGVSLGAGPSGFASYSSASGKAVDLPTRKLPLAADPDLWRWSVWASGFGGAQFVGADASAGAAANTSRVYGGAVGADYKLTPSTVAGFALAGGATSFNTYGLGSGKSDLFQAGLFIRQHFGQGYLSAALAYGWQDVTTDRSVGGEQLQGRFNVNGWSGRLEGGYRFEVTGMGVTPYAAAQFTAMSLPNYAETALTGTGVFALGYAARDVSTTRSELGLRADTNLTLAGLPLTLRGSVAWVHNFNPSAQAVASFQSLPGSTFLVSGAAVDRNALRTTAIAEFSLTKNISLAATFDGEFAENSRSLGGKGAIRFKW